MDISLFDGTETSNSEDYSEYSSEVETNEDILLYISSPSAPSISPISFSSVQSSEIGSEDEIENVDDQKLLPLVSQELSSSHMTLPSYCIVGDNIDKYVKPRYERIGASGNRQLHYFHYYASLNRISVDELSLSLPVLPSNIAPANVECSLLPSSEDDTIIRKNMITLVSRILAPHLEAMGFDCLRLVDWHISHKYKDEMARKSEIVCYFKFCVFWNDSACCIIATIIVVLVCVICVIRYP